MREPGLLQNSRLHSVDPGSGGYRVLGSPDWPGSTRSVFADGSLFIQQGNRLHRVSPADGSWSLLSDTNWQNATSMVAAWGWIFIIENSTLHRVDPRTGAYAVLGRPGTWPSYTAMVAY